jgi:hypothetical protein
MNRLWTEDEDNIIRADTAARIPRPVTAAKLDRPVHATRNRALKLRQQIQVHKAWTTEEAAALRRALTQEVPAPTDKALSRRFDRQIASIRSKIKELGLAGPRRYRCDRSLAAERAQARAARAAARQVRIAEAAASRAAKQAAREQARRDRLAAQLAIQAQNAAARAAAKAAKPVVVKPAVAKPRVPQPEPPLRDREATMARMREAWRRVSAAPARPHGDPAEAERRLLAVLGLR